MWWFHVVFLQYQAIKGNQVNTPTKLPSPLSLSAKTWGHPRHTSTSANQRSESASPTVPPLPSYHPVSEQVWTASNKRCKLTGIIWKYHFRHVPKCPLIRSFKVYSQSTILCLVIHNFRFINVYFTDFIIICVNWGWVVCGAVGWSAYDSSIIFDQIRSSSMSFDKMLDDFVPFPCFSSKSHSLAQPTCYKHPNAALASAVSREVKATFAVEYNAKFAPNQSLYETRLCIMLWWEAVWLILWWTIMNHLSRSVNNPLLQYQSKRSIFDWQPIASTNLG